MKRHIEIILILASMSLFSPVSLNAQKKQYIFEHIAVEDGLSSNEVNIIFQDNTGFLWFGTVDGLNKYDGYNFKVYKNDPIDSTSLSNNWILTICEDDSGILWIGTNGGGLNKYDRATETFKRYINEENNQNSLSNNDVRVIFKDHRGFLWIGTFGGGVDKFDPVHETFVHYRMDENNINSLNNDNVRTICEDQSGILWIGTEGGGLNKFDPQEENFIHYKKEKGHSNSLIDNNVMYIYKDRSGILWIATNDGLNEYDPVEDIFRQYRDMISNTSGMNHNQIRTICEDKSGNIWIGTLGGLIKFDHEEKIFISYQNEENNPRSLSNNRIISIIEDRSGVLWIGTSKGGINKLYQSKIIFRHLREDASHLNSLIINHVMSICEDRSGIFWIGTYNNGLKRYDPVKEVFTHYYHEDDNTNSLSNEAVNVLYEDRTGILWIGTYNGLNRFDREKEVFIRYSYEEGNPLSLSGNKIRAICEDKSGRLWIGTNRGINLYNRKNNTFTCYTHNAKNHNSLSHDGVRVIYEDRSGILWVGTEGGLDRFDTRNEIFTNYHKIENDKNSLSYNKVRSIYEDSSGILWIGTRGGLNKYNRNTNQFSHYMEHDGLPSGVIFCILEGNYGNLWLSTPRGLSKFNPRTEIFKNYNKNDGLLNSQFELGSSFKTKNGELLFGGIHGIDIFHPDDVIENSNIPQIVFTSFKIFDKSVKFNESLMDIDKLKLSYKDNFFSFEFASLDFVNPLKNQYAYKLEGFNKEWIYCKKRRYVSYTNLDPGDYVFKVKGSNNDGIWNEEGISIKVLIPPPYWRTWWFRLIFVGILIIWIAAIYKLRMKSIKNKNQQLEEINIKLHEQIVERKHAEEEKEKIRAQLFQSQKMEAIGKLAGGVAHDFNNLLTAIHGCTDLVLLNIDKNDSLFTDLKEIQDATKRASDLTRQLLLFSRRHLMDFSPINLNKMITNILKMLQRLIGENIEIITSLNPALWAVMADTGTMEQVIMNLVINARDAMFEMGSLIVKTENIVLDKEQCMKITDSRSGKFVCLSVKDTGVGMDRATIQHIFEPFYSTKKFGKGTGLGLSVVYGIVKQHEGWINVHSNLKQGTEFRIYLPAVFIDSEEESKSSISIDQFKSSGERVLIIEDEESVLSFARRALKEYGYIVFTAANAFDALDIFEQKNGNFHLIFSDVVLPDKTGIELVNELLLRKPDLRILLSSGYTDQKSQWETINERGFSFLQKPYTLVDLLGTVKKVMNEDQEIF
jgi:ligand-binding sensor domain-containing protein/signal transduction histidine kinase/CheY-like chemotaxis protein